MNNSSRQYSFNEHFNRNEQQLHEEKRKTAQKKMNLIKGFLVITAGIMDAYSKLFCALLFWDKQFLEGEWLIKRIWEYEKLVR